MLDSGAATLEAWGWHLPACRRQVGAGRQHAYGAGAPHTASFHEHLFPNMRAPLAPLFLLCSNYNACNGQVVQVPLADGTPQANQYGTIFMWTDYDAQFYVTIAFDGASGNSQTFYGERQRRTIHAIFCARCTAAWTLTAGGMPMPRLKHKPLQLIRS